MLERVELLPEQVHVLERMVEAQRNMPSNQRHKFLLSRALGGIDTLHHRGFPEGQLHVYHGDLEVLARAGLLSVTYSSRGTPNYDVIPRGYRYYEYIRTRADQPAQEVEGEILSFLDAAGFRERHPLAYEKWHNAATRLWSAESKSELTTIGHLCREATQEFATSLVAQYRPENVTQDAKATVSRVRSVLRQRNQKLGSTEATFLDALVAYWGEVNDLIQRQEHGAQKEGTPVVWEDARRVVFQTAIVMFEIDRALARP